MRFNYVIPALACLLLPIHAAPIAGSLGIFEEHGDVGAVLHAGSVEYDPAKRTYTIAGSGENMWFATDAFQFVWKKVSGDVTLTADISFIGAGAEAHRKAVLTIRQSLDADSPYADVARHGDGLTSLQARDEKGVNTTEIQSATKAPTRVRIAKRGDYFYIWVAREGEALQFSGGSMRVPLHDAFYVGIGVCSHNKDVVEKAIFSNVELTSGVPTEAAPKLYSTIETVPVNGDRRVVYVTPGRLSAPAWTSDGDAIVFHSDAGMKKISAAGGRPEALDRFGATPSGPMATDKDLPLDGFRNYSPRLSPDGQIAFLSSAGDKPDTSEDQDVMLRVLSRTDGKVRVAAKFVGGKGSIGAPWSPDGRRLTFISYQWIQ